MENCLLSYACFLELLPKRLEEGIYPSTAGKKQKQKQSASKIDQRENSILNKNH